jgi:carbon-monoxide dehydrogenase medium subunit
MQGLMIGFDVARPADVDGALAALAEAGPGAKVLAGGTDLLIQLRFGAIHPPAVVDLSGVASLRRLEVLDDGDALIGARATVTQVERSVELARRFPALREAAQTLGSRQIRNTATVIGNVCHASPSAEFAPPLIALAAQAEIRGLTGERVIAIEDFAVGPGQNALDDGEIVTAIRVPAPPPRTGAAYEGLKIRKIMDIAVVSAGVAVSLDAGGACEDVRIALGAVAARAFRASRAEDVLRGRTPTPEVLREAAEAAAAEAKPITDVRATAEYRRAMVARSTLRALTSATDRARAA